MTPTEAHLAVHSASITVQDSAGRSIVLRRLSALDKLRLFKAAGPTLAQNPLWLGMATIACAVTEIDTIPIPPPVNEAQIEVLVAKLGDAGISAVATALSPSTVSDQATSAGN